MDELLKTKRRLLHIDSQYRLYISFVVGVIAYFIMRHQFTTPTVILLTWSSFAISTIILEWIVILSLHPRQVMKAASLEDLSRWIIFLFVVCSAIVSLFAILMLLRAPKTDHHSGIVTGHIIISMASVIISWILVHTVFTLRYAHMYYDTDTDAGEQRTVGGLEFPGNTMTDTTTEPDYLDFVYFAFVIGMTFQVSDVEISSRAIRRLAWFHGLISFAFNTAILALSINVISGLMS